MITQPAVPESRRDRIQRAAVEVARRYRVLGHDAPREGAAAFYLMLDLITFFDLCHANKLDEALDTVEKIKVDWPFFSYQCMKILCNAKVTTEKDNNYEIIEYYTQSSTL